MQELNPRQIGPWTTLTVESIYRNPWIHVEHHNVIRPDGREGIYGVVHFAHRALGVVPLSDDGFIWLVGQHRYPLDVYSWEIPEGGAEASETPLQGIQRELSEEAGLQAKEWIELGSVHTSNSVCNETATVFLALGITQGISHPDAEELLAVKKVYFREAVRMAAEGEITDAISIVALFRAEKWLMKNRPNMYF